MDESIFKKPSINNECPKCGGNDYVTKPAGDETYNECNDCGYVSGE